ncbi:MAG: chemotaxis protein CheB [Coleofasciculus sp. B1-GNL1-01]|uniref:chemotaxis protein CheB n=1 Tax=Coleofasciculus sp. B1-GNL1-01 TaxID=3068484 RepID=UPI003305007F
MPGHDIIVVGASAGGVEALKQLVAALPENLPAAIFIVTHVSRHVKSFLPNILNRRSPLPVAHATEHEEIVQGRIYVAPPDYHLLVKRGYVRLVYGPKENGCRPAVDPLFRTAAKAYGCRVVGVVLSGTLDDGTVGLVDVKRFGGVAIVQDPNDALFSGMPKSAIKHVDVDHILPLSSIASALVRLAHESVTEEGATTMSNQNETEIEPDVVEFNGAAMRERDLGIPASLACPDCGGMLYYQNDKGLLKYRCRVGHAWSAGSLVAGQSETQEQALWTAIRSLEERGELMSQMAANARNNNRLISAQRFEAKAQEARQRADIIRQALFQGQFPTTPASAAATQDSNPNQENELKTFKLVVLVAKTGGLRVLSHILAALPEDFPAALVVVQHLDSQSSANWISDVVNHSTTLPLKLPEAGESIQPGIAYIAPPTEHLLVNPNGTFSFSQAAFVDFDRPSADLLLQSVAATFKERAIAVILSGTGNDGALGVQAIHKMGGKVIAQDEDTCDFFEMPSAAIQTGAVDWVVPMSAIASTLISLVMIGKGEQGTANREL